MCSVKEREREATEAGVYPKGAFTGGEDRTAGAVTAPGLDGGVEAFQLFFQH